MRLTSYLPLSITLLLVLFSSQAFGGIYTWTASSTNNTAANLSTSSDNNSSLGNATNDLDTITIGGASLTFEGFSTTNMAKNWISSGAGTITSASLIDTITNYAGDIGVKSGTNAGGITSNNFVQFNPFSVQTALGPLVSVAITVVNNGTVNATWDVWDNGSENAPGTTHQLYASSSIGVGGSDTFTVSGSNLNSLLPYLSVSGGDCEMVIKQLQITTSPEPSTMVFCALAGLALVSGKLYRRFSKKSA